MPPTSPTLFAGTRLSAVEIASIASGERRLVVTSDVRDVLERLRRDIHATPGTSAVYGQTTGVGANKATEIDAGDDQHAMRLLRSHAVEIGDPLPRETVRAMLAVRLNQLSVPGSGIDVRVVDALARMLDEDALPVIHSGGASVGTADLSALARTALTLAGEVPTSRGPSESGPSVAPVVFDASSALPFLSSSALTLGRAALALVDAARVARASDAVFAITALAVGANPQHWSRAAAGAGVGAGVEEVATRVSAVFEAGPPSERTARVQDPFGIRAYTFVHGALADALARATTITEVLASTAQENPLFVRDGAKVEAIHHGGFFQIGLTLDLDTLTNCLASLVPLARSRLTMLGEPAFTGLAPFLAAGPPGSSGTMVVEYVAAAAGAEMRSASAPVAGGTSVLSRGSEEDAPFAPQAVTQLERSLRAWRTILGSELLLGLRALDQQEALGGLRSDLRRITRPVVDRFGDHTDRDLGPALAASVEALHALGQIGDTR